MSHSFISKMARFNNSDAIVFNGKIYSYADLIEMSEKWRQFIDREHIQIGQVVALESPASPEACAALIALIDHNTIIVPLTTLPPTKRQEFHEVAQVEFIITLDGTEQLCSYERTYRHAYHELYSRLRESSSPGLVLFSSGTSGASKATVLDFTKVLGRYGEPTRPRRTLSFLNLDHIGGINTFFHTLSQGGTIITIPKRTPDTVFEAIATHKVEVLPTTPTFLNMVLISGVYERYDVQSLQLITYGTEPMPLQTLQRLHLALPNVRFKQTYGLTELGILPTKSRDDNTLWVKMGGAGFAYKIIDNILWIRSDMAMLGYLNAPAPFDSEGFFNTQDLVETDGDYLRVLGRSSEIINVGGEKVYPSEVESVLLEVPNVAEVTVVGQPNPVTGMVVKAKLSLVHDEDLPAITKRIRQYCRQRLDAFKIPAVIEIATEVQHSDRFKKVRNVRA